MFSFIRRCKFNLSDLISTLHTLLKIANLIKCTGFLMQIGLGTVSTLVYMFIKIDCFLCEIRVMVLDCGVEQEGIGPGCYVIESLLASSQTI